MDKRIINAYLGLFTESRIPDGIDNINIGEKPRNLKTTSTPAPVEPVEPDEQPIEDTDDKTVDLSNVKIRCVVRSVNIADDDPNGGEYDVRNGRFLFANFDELIDALLSNEKEFYYEFDNDEEDDGKDKEFKDFWRTYGLLCVDNRGGWGGWSFDIYDENGKELADLYNEGYDEMLDEAKKFFESDNCIGKTYIVEYGSSSYTKMKITFLAE